MKFRRKIDIVTAYTFDQLVAHGLTQTPAVANGLPWAFQVEGLGVTHENDNQYLVASPNQPMVKVFRSTVLVIGADGKPYTIDTELFDRLYEPLPDAEQAPGAVAAEAVAQAGRGLSFGQALDAIKAGRSAAREGWNGQGMFVSVREGSADISDEKLTVQGVRRGLFAKGHAGTITRMPCLDLALPSGAHAPGWAPSQTDLLAEDWFLLEPVKA